MENQKTSMKKQTQTQLSLSIPAELQFPGVLI